MRITIPLASHQKKKKYYPLGNARTYIYKNRYRIDHHGFLGLSCTTEIIAQGKKVLIEIIDLIDRIV